MEDKNINIIQKQFASFCCTLIKRAAVDFYREEERCRLHNVPTVPINTLAGSNAITYTQFEKDEYGYCLYISTLKRNVFVSDEKLAGAINCLPVENRDILLMYYMLGMNDRQIACYYDTYRQRITYRRRKAIKQLTNIMTSGGNYEK